MSRNGGGQPWSILASTREAAGEDLVGPVTAAAFASTIDVKRFRNAHQVEAYLGLTPSETSSGERQQSPITKADNSRMRRLLVQIAVTILRLRSPRTEALRHWASSMGPRSTVSRS